MAVITAWVIGSACEGVLSDSACHDVDTSRLTIRTLYTILCNCLFSEVTVQAVTELDNKAAHRHTPVPQRHGPFLRGRLARQPHDLFH